MRTSLELFRRESKVCYEFSTTISFLLFQRFIHSMFHGQLLSYQQVWQFECLLLQFTSLRNVCWLRDCVYLLILQPICIWLDQSFFDFKRLIQKVAERHKIPIAIDPNTHEMKFTHADAKLNLKANNMVWNFLFKYVLPLDQKRNGFLL